LVPDIANCPAKKGADSGWNPPSDTVSTREEWDDGGNLDAVPALSCDRPRGGEALSYTAPQHVPKADNAVAQDARAHPPRHDHDCLDLGALGVLILDIARQVYHFIRLSLAASNDQTALLDAIRLP
jgi:hypothetical protein